MSDLIDRQAAIDALDALCDRECVYIKNLRSVMCGACRLGSAFDVIEQLPSAEPVRHGRWIKIHPGGIYECSECGGNVMTDHIDVYRFCHQCGVMMDGEI